MKKAKRKKDGPRNTTAVDTHIGAQMRKRRLALKIGQAHLAMASGVTKQQIQKYEAGPRQRGAVVRNLQRTKIPLSSMFVGLKAKK